MLHVLRRLGLGFALIALASAILLFSDRGRRVASESNVFRVAILQHATTARTSIFRSRNGRLAVLACC
jgi:hypothetical protein